MKEFISRCEEYKQLTAEGDILPPRVLVNGELFEGIFDTDLELDFMREVVGDDF